VVGDDLLVTNPKRVKQGIDGKWCNALLLKVNQIGSLTESINAVRPPPIVASPNCAIACDTNQETAMSALLMTERFAAAAWFGYRRETKAARGLKHGPSQEIMSMHVFRNLLSQGSSGGGTCLVVTLCRLASNGLVCKQVCQHLSRCFKTWMSAACAHVRR